MTLMCYISVVLRSIEFSSAEAGNSDEIQWDLSNSYLGIESLPNSTSSFLYYREIYIYIARHSKQLELKSPSLIGFKQEMNMQHRLPNNIRQR